MKIRTLIGAAAVTLALVLALSACGGGKHLPLWTDYKRAWP